VTTSLGCFSELANMTEDLLNIFISVIGLYFFIGFLFGLYFIVKGVTRLDHDAKGTSFWFRLIILPGSIGLWPILLAKMIKR